jgi:outer membrane murein-binding lipoprotein Lpp
MTRSRKTLRPKTPLTIDNVVGHWAVKVLVAALVALASYVITDKLDSIDKKVEQAATADAVEEVKVQLSEFKGEHRAFRDQTQAAQNTLSSEMTAVKARVDTLEADRKNTRQEGGRRPTKTTRARWRSGG